MNQKELNMNTKQPEKLPIGSMNELNLPSQKPRKS